MFMYIFLGGLVVLMLFGVYQVLETRTVCVGVFFSFLLSSMFFFLVFDHSNLLIWLMQRKRIPLKVEKGTGGMNNVDISWIPQETLNALSESTACFSWNGKWGWSYAKIWCWKFCLTDKASPKASPRKRANRAAGADQWERFLHHCS